MSPFECVAMNFVGAAFSVVVKPVFVHVFATVSKLVIVSPANVKLVLAVKVVNVPAAGVLPPITTPFIVPLVSVLSVIVAVLPEIVVVAPAKFKEFASPTLTPSSCTSTEAQQDVDKIRNNIKNKYLLNIFFPPVS
jgi:hypothetical protein